MKRIEESKQRGRESKQRVRKSARKNAEAVAPSFFLACSDRLWGSAT
jgi:hypothetical protein